MVVETRSDHDRVLSVLVNEASCDFQQVGTSLTQNKVEMQNFRIFLAEWRFITIGSLGLRFTKASK